MLLQACGNSNSGFQEELLEHQAIRILGFRKSDQLGIVD